MNGLRLTSTHWHCHIFSDTRRKSRRPDQGRPYKNTEKMGVLTVLDLGDLAGFVVAPKDCDSLPESYFKRHQQSHLEIRICN